MRFSCLFPRVCDRRKHATHNVPLSDVLAAATKLTARQRLVPLHELVVFVLLVHATLPAVGATSSASCPLLQHTATGGAFSGVASGSVTNDTSNGFRGWQVNGGVSSTSGPVWFTAGSMMLVTINLTGFPIPGTLSVDTCSTPISGYEPVLDTVLMVGTGCPNNLTALNVIAADDGTNDYPCGSAGASLAALFSVPVTQPFLYVVAQGYSAQPGVIIVEWSYFVQTPTNTATRTITAKSSPSRWRTSTPSGSRTAMQSGPCTATPSPASTTTPTPSVTPTLSTAPLVYVIYTGHYQYFSVPPGMTSLGVYMWGGGGGGGGGVSQGGAGAFVSGVLVVTPNETLRLIVGRGGPWLGTRGYDQQGSGGGGGSPTVAHPLYHAGAGGGRSCIQRLLGGGYVDIVTAGGGGGGGGYNASGGAGGYVQGRRGGDQAATTADLASPVARSLGLTSVWGGGGGPSAGGKGSYTGSSGVAWSGGDASKCLRNQCGGGGGWYGGAAGSDAPGGGGSSFALALSAASGADGNGPLPASDSPFYIPGVAVGGQPAHAGGNGLVVFALPSAMPSPSVTASSSATRMNSRTPSGTRTTTRTTTRTRTVTRTSTVTRSSTRKAK